MEDKATKGEHRPHHDAAVYGGNLRSLAIIVRSVTTFRRDDVDDPPMRFEASEDVPICCLEYQTPLGISLLKDFILLRMSCQHEV